MKKALFVTLVLVALLLVGQACNDEPATPTPTPTATATATPVTTPTIVTSKIGQPCTTNADCIACTEECKGQCVASKRICVKITMYTATSEGEFTNLIGVDEPKCKLESSFHGDYIAQVGGAPIRFLEEIVDGPC